MRRFAAVVVLSLGLIGFAQPMSAQGIAADIPLASGGSQRVLFASPADPRAVLIMFPGGSGIVDISAGGESVTTTKRVIFSQPIKGHEDQPPNQNPTVTSIQTYVDRDTNDVAIDPVTRNVSAGLVDSASW